MSPIAWFIQTVYSKDSYCALLCSTWRVNVDSFPHSFALTYHPSDTYPRCPQEFASFSWHTHKNNNKFGLQWPIWGDVFVLSFCVYDERKSTNETCLMCILLFVVCFQKIDMGYNSLANFAIGKKIGRGQFSEVYRATYVLDHTTVALKKIQVRNSSHDVIPEMWRLYYKITKKEH